jgi:hypothetical protein
VIAREITTDAADGMVSIIKLIDKFGFAYNPKELSEKGVVLGKEAVLFGAKYAIGTSWLLDEKVSKDTPMLFEINIVDASGVNRGGPSNEVKIPSGNNRINLNLMMDGLPVSGAGNYKIVAKLKLKTGAMLAEAEYPFDVELAEEAKNN